MITVYVTIGNSDDKLTQSGWSTFVRRVDKVIEKAAGRIHFSGYSNPVAPWQNACWSFDLEEIQAAELRASLAMLARQCGQRAIAWAVGTNDMIWGTREEDDQVAA